ncbi:PTS sugar transporter subunit IIA [Spiroplasma sp. SV19]|uniref:PTS sugar transporter subunit IIA n=1 Tax=Spiroplasma sp. SV19 TaxID=2570468 RepID=UPI0024B7E485|nr:PTS sugar transporter subunit IIA [Spiroplasma sp. SV19]WHQ37343.1 PTS sugar transporter subunit IIA [Spiroplasma sp. SV19]
MKIFDEKLLQYIDKPIKKWEEAIKIGSNLLIENDYVQNDFPNKIIEITNDLGPYYILASKLALLHIMPDSTILRTGISFTYFKIPVAFQEEEKYHIKYCLALSAEDNFSHIELLQQIAKLFAKKEFLTDIKKCSSTTELINIVKKYDN